MRDDTFRFNGQTLALERCVWFLWFCLFGGGGGGWR